MSAYLIADISVHDAATFGEYVARVPALVAKHGGEYLARGGEAAALEGGWSPGRVVVLRFPDLAAAQAFVDDPEYAPVKALRQAVATTRMIVVSGV